MVVVAVLGGVAVGVALAAARAARRPVAADPDAALTRAVAVLREQAAAERDVAVRQALQQAALLNREHLDAGLAAGHRELAARHQDADVRLEQVERRVRDELARVGDLVANSVGTTPRRSAGWRPRWRPMPRPPPPWPPPPRASGRRWPARRPAASGASAWPRTCCGWPASSSTSTTTSRRPSQGRAGPARLHVPAAQGPRPLHGRQVPAGRLPPLPRRRHRRRARRAHRDAFLRDVRLRVQELAGRDYASVRATSPSVDYVLLFLPNETLSGFIHEHDPGAARRRPRPAGRAVLAAHAVRLARRHPPGVRQLHGRADVGGDPRRARRVRAAVGRSSPARSTTVGQPARLGAEGVRRSRRHPPARARAAAGAAWRRCAPTAASPSTSGTCPTPTSSHACELQGRRRACAPRQPYATSGLSRQTAAHEPARRSTSSSTTARDPTYTRRRAGRRHQPGRCGGGSATASGCGARSRACSERGRPRLLHPGRATPTTAGPASPSPCSPTPGTACGRVLARHRLRLADGLDVRIHGYLDFYAPTGRLSLVMDGIDARFTLGELAADRDAAAPAASPTAGLLGAQRRPAGAGRPLRDRRGHQRRPARPGTTSCTSWRRSGLGFRLAARRRAGAGRPTPSPPVAAAIARRSAASRVDVIVVIRGGGSRTELATFDDEAHRPRHRPSPVPVLTGLGHEVDRSVADEVAHTAYKTPTACAGRAGRAGAAYFDAPVGRRRAGVAARTDDTAVRLADQRLDRTAGGRRRRGGGRSRRRRAASWAAVRPTPGRARRAAAVRASDRRPRPVAARLRVHDPAPALARGWSITRRADGTLVRSTAGVAAGDELVTTLADGALTSVVREPGP